MGDKTEHSAVIKRVHAELRAKCLEDGSSDMAVWRRHVSQEAGKAEYAAAMLRQATEVWAERHAAAPELCRLVWTHRAILEYHTEPQLARARAYDDRLAERHGAAPHAWTRCDPAEATRLNFDTPDRMALVS
ncbi:S-adenosylmethionine sensor upstream of mTORC1-like [Pollicipes pollicipes]|uniref:S-adenosylmethionine sensor upstream of mTORC1-like n=1 Tax=Pollicipes pollicipes TaxID=41117 RepID=UPI001884D7A1|nr:S-adenosylmethionine sensor upstream of mTORC1-like [Pollicipes pollicipes]